MDPMGPMQVESLGEKKYGEKSGRLSGFSSDHGREFENSSFSNFCNSEGISHEFSAPITPQQNEIVERKN